jgi:hypothetical protein
VGFFTIFIRHFELSLLLLGAVETGPADLLARRALPLRPEPVRHHQNHLPAEGTAAATPTVSLGYVQEGELVNIRTASIDVFL